MSYLKHEHHWVMCVHEITRRLHPIQHSAVF